MSRIAKMPVIIPDNVDVKINNQVVTVKGKNGKLIYTVDSTVTVNLLDKSLVFFPKKKCPNGWSRTGTTRSLLNAMIIGVTVGFVKKLQLIGVGYRASVNNNIVTLFLGFSHKIEYLLPNTVIAECPSQTEIILKSANKQIIGQVAADLRAYRPPEPYKGKGIRYHDEIVRIKDAKKK